MSENKDKQGYFIINDAVHGVMAYHRRDKDLFKSIIDSRVFQRLRHIKQMGLVDLVFPTANHSRFSHSLGTAYVAAKIADTLELSDKETRYAIVGALLHDIGHGPFSHAFEKFIANKNDEMVKHEQWTAYFLHELKDELDSEGLKYEQLSRLILKKDAGPEDEPNYYLIRDIISSQVDADRLDYLLRDAHFCGVPYGNPDLEWITKHATKIQEIENAPRLGFLKKSEHAIEHFLLCRRMMTSHVCFHKKVSFYENILVKFLNELTKALFLENAKLKQEDIFIKSELKDFLKRVFEFKNSDNHPDTFVNHDNYMLYKSLSDSDIWLLIRELSKKDYDGVSYMAKQIYERKPHTTIVFENVFIDPVTEHVKDLREKFKIPEWQLFVTENNHLAYSTTKEPTLIACKDSGRVYQIEKNLSLLSKISDQKDKFRFLAIHNKLEDGQKKEIKDRLLKYMDFPEKW